MRVSPKERKRPSPRVNDDGVVKKQKKRSKRNSRDVRRHELEVSTKGDKPYVAPYFEANLKSSLVCELRSSDRFLNLCSHFKEKEIRVSLPLIDKLGFITGDIAHTTMMKPSAYIATSVSTISQRALRHVLRNNKSKIGPWRYKKMITSYSFTYLVTKSKWMWDRFLYLSKDLPKNIKILEAINRRLLSRQDDYTRFVHSHVSHETKWLLFRAKRPRDKSCLHKRFQFDRNAKALGETAYHSNLVTASSHVCKVMTLLSSRMLRNRVGRGLLLASTQPMSSHTAQLGCDLLCRNQFRRKSP
jgi:hypothetical protein